MNKINNSLKAKYMYVYIKNSNNNDNVYDADQTSPLLCRKYTNKHKLI